MEDRRQRENGEEICYKLVFVRGKGVADALQKMAEQRQDREKNELVCRSRHVFALCRLI